MQFGHFDDEKREYVIETPRTPYPWINYLGSEKFFCQSGLTPTFVNLNGITKHVSLRIIL